MWPPHLGSRLCCGQRVNAFLLWHSVKPRYLRCETNRHRRSKTCASCCSLCSESSAIAENLFQFHCAFILRLLLLIICRWYVHLLPLPSARQHQSYGDCLEVKREYYQNCSVLDCVTQCSQSTPHLCEQFLQVKQIGFVTLGPLRCA